MGAIGNAEMRDYDRYEERDREKAEAAEIFAAYRQSRQNLLAASKTIVKGTGRPQDFFLIQKNVELWKEVILTEGCFSIDTLFRQQTNLTPAALYIVNTIGLILQSKAFAFEDKIVTKAQLQTLLNITKDILSFLKPEGETNLHPFLTKLMEFSTKIANESLSTDEALCLHRIIEDYSQGLLGSCDNFLGNIKKCLNASDTLQPYLPLVDQSVNVRPVTFAAFMQKILDKECFPYFRVMNPSTIEYINTTKNSDFIVSFILSRHRGKRCVVDPTYAPGGKITYAGIQAYLCDSLGYYSHHEYTQNLAELYELRKTLLKSFHSFWSFQFQSSIGSQLVILDVLEAELKRCEEQKALPKLAADAVREKYSAHLKGFFSETKTGRLLREMGQGHESSLPKALPLI